MERSGAELLCEPCAEERPHKALWRAWTRDRDEKAREQLIGSYSELVRILAAKSYRGRYSEELEFGDYVQFGMVGLLEAIDRFEPDQPVKFESYASHRITGAILSGVESLSEKQKQISVRRRVRAERTRSLAEAQTAGKGSAEANALERLADIAVGLAIGFMLDDTGMYVDREGASGNSPYEHLELAQLKRRLSELVDQLPAQERRVIRSHYYQRLQFEEIAQDMGLTKGRISQIHHCGLRRLRGLHGQLMGAMLVT